MLVLSRKVDDEIYIGDDIIITVVRVIGGTVKIGVDAPRDVTVLRGELAKPPRPDIAAEEKYLTEKHGPAPDPIDPYDPRKGE